MLRNKTHAMPQQAKMQDIPDLMVHLAQLDDRAVRRIRKTAEDPPRASVIDTISVITGLSPSNAHNIWHRVQKAFPEVSTIPTDFKFSGRGQRETPVTDARGMVDIIFVLPGRAAAKFRKMAADVMVRYLGGDPTIVEEVAANRLAQGGLDDDDPARIFGQTVESEAVKRKREEAELTELDGRAKLARVQAATDVVRLALGTLTDLGLPVSDRDRMLAKDIVTTAAFVQHPALENPDEKEICLQQFCMERGRAGLHMQLGKKAKKLYLADHPTYKFRQKDVYANGQMVPANCWTESMRDYLDKALQEL